MNQKNSDGAMFQALLKFWRNKRGLSQLDLSLMANVSARHLSFLENGRAQASEDMVLRLAQTLDLSMRDKNALLTAAGHPSKFAVPPSDSLSGTALWVIEKMLAHHEPYPLTVLSPSYDVLYANNAAMKLVRAFVAQPEHLTTPLNVFHLVLDPKLIRPYVTDWVAVARLMLDHLQRQRLEHPNDARLHQLVDSVSHYAGVSELVRSPDFTVSADPILPFRLARGELELSFVTTVTAFSAPQNVTIEELRIESYYPADAATDAACRLMAQ